MQEIRMNPVDMTIFSDYICPYCFMANEIIKRIKQEYNINITWKPFELHPYGSWTHINLDYIRMAWENVERIAKENKIKIELPSGFCDSMKALETAEFAREYGKFDECHDLIFNAYFLELKNIENEKVLLNIIEKLDLNPDQLKQCWKEKKYLNIIKKSKQELYSAGITSVPTFFIGNKNPRIIIGVYPQEKIEKVIKKFQLDI